MVRPGVKPLVLLPPRSSALLSWAALPRTSCRWLGLSVGEWGYSRPLPPGLSQVVRWLRG